jgi:hypothetical protein
MYYSVDCIQLYLDTMLLQMILSMLRSRSQYSPSLNHQLQVLETSFSTKLLTLIVAILRMISSFKGHEQFLGSLVNRVRQIFFVATSVGLPHLH